MSNRRAFITLVGGAAAWPLAARAQVSPKRRPLIAWLSGGIATGPAGTYPAHFLDRMRELGYLEGRDFDMVYRFAEGLQDRFSISRTYAFLPIFASIDHTFDLFAHSIICPHGRGAGHGDV